MIVFEEVDPEDPIVSISRFSCKSDLAVEESFDVGLGREQDQIGIRRNFVTVTIDLEPDWLEGTWVAPSHKLLILGVGRIYAILPLTKHLHQLVVVCLRQVGQSGARISQHEGCLNRV